MGLIKTAIIAGAGIYAVKKISESSERRHNNNPSQSQYYNSPPQNQYQYKGSPLQQQQQQQHSQGQRDLLDPFPQMQMPLEFSDSRPPQQQGQPMYLTNNAYAPLPYGYNVDTEDTSTPPPQYQNQQNGYGPIYGVRPEKQGAGFVEPDEVLSESDFTAGRADNGRKGTGTQGATFLNTLAQQAMGMDKSGKGRDLVGKFFSK